MQEGQNREVPFFFATVKGYTGHQESAAGAVGLIEATQLVQRHALPPALHLRNLNPHVHGSLARCSVSIARGGPYAAPSTYLEGRLLVGVSSFGAQGTNAHALVCGTGTSSVLATPNNSNSGNNTIPWNSARFWVAPQIQTLFAAALVRKRTKASGGGVTVFEVDLAAPRLAYLWQYNVSERPYLPPSGVLAMASSAATVLSNDDTMRQLPALLGATLPAPLMLPGLRRGPSAGGVYAALTVKPALASAEIVYAQQKVLVCRLGSAKVPSAAADAANTAPSVALRSAIIVPKPAAHIDNTFDARSGIFASTAAVAFSEHALHPAILDAAISQAAMCLPTEAISPPTWLRSISAIVLPAIVSSTASSSRMYIATLSQEEDGWAVGNAQLEPISTSSSGVSSASGGVHLVDLVVGEHSYPPTTPGPNRLSPESAKRKPTNVHVEDIEGAEAVPAEEPAADGRLPADHPLLAMSEEERMLHLQAQVMTEVRNVVGHPIHPEEPLMSAGLDSRGGMELRRTLATALGMQLPVTLLYDYQSIDAIVEYINGAVVEAAAKAGDQGPLATADGEESDEEVGYYTRGGGGSKSTALATSSQPQISKLLKTLRPSPTERPLFLAAPGVANAQSAYFSFSTFLQWSTQPIYVLDKDNDLDLRALALQNASDIVAVCPEGPYLVGGHSYGGAVAVEIAMVLESWGKEVGLVLVRKKI